MDNREFKEMLAALPGLEVKGAPATQLEKFKQLLPMLFAEGDVAFELLDEVINYFGPKLLNYADAIRNIQTDSDIRTIEQYKSAGVPVELAVKLMVARYQGIASAITTSTKIK